MTDLPAIEELRDVMENALADHVAWRGRVEIATNAVLDAVVRPLLEENERLWGENDAMAVWTVHAEAEIAGLRTEVEALRAGVGYRQVGWRCTEHGSGGTLIEMDKAKTFSDCVLVPVYVKEEQV